MAGMFSSAAAHAAPLSLPPEPPAAEGHGGGGGAENDDEDDDDVTFFPLLDLLERFPDIFAQKVLAHLDPIDRTFLAQGGGAWRATVAASGLPRAGTQRVVLKKSVWTMTHKISEFCTSVERLAWAKDNGCPWVAWTFAFAARGGRLDVLRWARDHGCPWDWSTCAHDGNLEVLWWAREHECPWDADTCYWAAAGGHLEVLQWARAHGCPWDKQFCEHASARHPDTLAWLRAQPY